MSDITEAVARAQAQLAAAQAAAAEEVAKEKAAGDSQAALAAEEALGKGIGPYLGDLIRRVEAIEAKVFGPDPGSAQPAAYVSSEPSPQG